MSSEKLKVGDVVKFLTPLELNGNPDNKDGHVYKIFKENFDFYYIGPNDGWFKNRFKKATIEEIVKAKLLGKYFD